MNCDFQKKIFRKSSREKRIFEILAEKDYTWPEVSEHVSFFRNLVQKVR